GMEPVQRVGMREQLRVALVAQQHEHQVGLARLIQRMTGAPGRIPYQRLPQLRRRTLLHLEHVFLLPRRRFETSTDSSVRLAARWRECQPAWRSAWKQAEMHSDPGFQAAPVSRA